MAREPLYRKAQQLLKAYISEHQLGPGDPLPPEAEMATAFGMSRLSLREAIKGLETIGLLRTMHGGRVCVAEFSFAPILDNLPYSLQLSVRDLRDMLELRESLEEGLVPKARRSIRPADLRELRLIAESMRVAPNELAIAEIDRRFHRRVYEPLGNHLVLEMIDLFWTVFHRLGESVSPRVTRTSELADLHLEIVDALGGDDDAAATAAMARHFDDVRDWLEGELAAEALLR